MRDETIGSFLTRLAARSAAPGGGATGALHAAQAAALLAMVARFSDGPAVRRRDGGPGPGRGGRPRRRGGRPRGGGRGRVQKVVIAAYQLPKDTPEAKAARSAAIADALGGASGRRPT